MIKKLNKLNVEKIHMYITVLMSVSSVVVVISYIFADR